MSESGPFMRVGATQVASSLASQAHGALAAEGCGDQDIEAWSRAFLAECDEGTVQDFLRWVHDRGLSPCPPTSEPSTGVMMAGSAGPSGI